MIRFCDGTDPNLIMYLNFDGDRMTDHPRTGRPVPCDCGKRFNDINHLVIYPHEEF